jgi:hypothetical protein
LLDNLTYKKATRVGEESKATKSRNSHAYTRHNTQPHIHQETRLSISVNRDWMKNSPRFYRKASIMQ